MEPVSYLKFIMALAFVLALIAGGVWLIKRFSFLPGLGNVRKAGAAARLAVVESKAIDARRRLVIIRRDKTEHLILMGPNSEIVIETNIKPGAPSEVPDEN